MNFRQMDPKDNRSAGDAFSRQTAMSHQKFSNSAHNDQKEINPAEYDTDQAEDDLDPAEYDPDQAMDEETAAAQFNWEPLFSEKPKRAREERGKYIGEAAHENGAPGLARESGQSKDVSNCDRLENDSVTDSQDGDRRRRAAADLNELFSKKSRIPNVLRHPLDGKRRFLIFAGSTVLILAVILFLVGAIHKNMQRSRAAGLPGAATETGKDGAGQSASGESAKQSLEDFGNGSAADAAPVSYALKNAPDAQNVVSQNIFSSHVLLADVKDKTVIASRDGDVRISPASMTKILTLLVAVEHLDNLDEPVTVSLDATDFAYSNDCSVAGFEDGEQVTARDLLYATILPSGADAAQALAIHVAGSPEAFAGLMNDKLEELGLADSAHFTNCVGIYDENHYCTLQDMAEILLAAMDNETCKKVLMAHTYTTSPTKEHPEGLLLSNWFLRRIEDRAMPGQVMGAKTGFVNESGSCAASFFMAEDGKEYICVTADSSSSWRCIFDQVAVYRLYTPEGKSHTYNDEITGPGAAIYTADASGAEDTGE